MTKVPPGLRFLAPLLVAALACSLGGPAPTAAPLATATPFAATQPPSPTVLPTTPPQPSPSPTPGVVEAHTLLDAVLTQLEDEGRDEGEVLAAALRYFVGETRSAEAFGSFEITDANGSGLLRLAENYLANGPEGPARAEIERLLNLIAPPIERLEFFAQPAPAQGTRPPGQALLAARPPGDEARCRELWAAGFPAGDAVVCFEYTTVTIGDVTHRVFYPAYWSPADPRREDLPLAAEALQSALGFYNTFGPDPVMPIDLVFTELAAVNAEGRRDPGIYAIGERSPDRARCRVGVFPAGVRLDSGAFQQTIAHEAFHCYQFTNLSAQERGPNPRSNMWWVEGSAEYFGSLVYPEVNDEWEYIPAFDDYSLHRTLFRLSYENVLFFQYLHHEPGVGPEGVLGLLRSMPMAGSFDEQRAALAGFPNIQNLFHGFARAYLDRALKDTTGALLPVNPQMPEPYRFTVGAGEEHFLQPPFFIARYHLNWQPEARFALTTGTSGGEGMSATRPLRSPGLWNALPAEVNGSCDGVDHLLLVTTTAASVDDGHIVDLAYTGEAAPGCDHCLVGTWELQNESYIPYATSNETPGVDSSLEYRSVTGRMTLTFAGDGLASSRQEAFTIDGVIEQTDLSGNPLEISVSMVLNGAGNAQYTADAGTLVFANSAFDVLLQTIMNGSALPPTRFQEADFPGGSLLTGQASYTCGGDTLTYAPLVPDQPALTPLEFRRTEP